MKSKLWFALPKIKNERPIWNGSFFVIKNKKLPILEYSQNFDGWNDDLTIFHELNAGHSHPIDIFSRKIALFNLEQNVIKKNQLKILEIGSSSGYLLTDIIKKLPKVSLVGSDVIKKPLILVAKKLKNIPIIKFDITNMPFDEPIFDQVVALNVLEHIKDDNLALKNINRLLVKKGTLLIEVPAFQFLYDNYDKELKHFRRYNKNDLLFKLKQNGFKVNKISYMGFFIFPIFMLFKLKNRLFKIKYKPDKTIRQTSRKSILSYLFALEFLIMKFFSLPFGVRIVVNASKENENI